MTTIPFDAFQDIWNIFLLVLVRITGMFFLSPVFGRRNIPNYFKVGFCFIFSVITANSIQMPAMSYTSLTAYVVLIARELLVGLTLGFISYLLFSSIYIAGQLIDMRIGFGMVSVFDPLTNVQIPVTADFYVIIATVMMLITDAHHLLIQAMVDSYKILPIGEVVFNGEAISQIFKLFTGVFALGFKIAAPITVSILITDISLGIVSKSMPQMNVFMLGMPIKIILGLSIIFITISAFKGIVNVIIQGTYEEIYEFLRQAKGS
ncbi:MAG: flagellar type III secretion system protein FliR [Clostridiaceae bacterium]|jgi:flagellar biosynthetic protein FliR|nr:flagellar type III secretion system protein FliR [Clostridiaceae bacterium]